MTSGKRGEQRSSALWGTGNRGGETRSNALWGKGGRGFVTALVAMLAISVPLAGSSNGHGYKAPDTYVAPVLKKLAEGNGKSKVPVIPSGIQTGRADFGNRVLASVNLSTLPNNSAGDGRGHGTFVAGVAAGGAYGYTGATPQANLVSVDVMDDEGMARTSDVIAGC